jgi:hypothetical protein
MLKCFLVSQDEIIYRQYEPGAMWFAPWYIDHLEPQLSPEEAHRRCWFISLQYFRKHWKQRPPIVVCCPDERHWVVDQVADNGPGWTVTGDAPLITCQPSIKTGGKYHGYLTHGVFSDSLPG